MDELNIQQSQKLMFQPEDYNYIVVYIAEGTVATVVHFISTVKLVVSDGLPLYKIPAHMKTLSSADFLMARGCKEGCSKKILQ